MMPMPTVPPGDDRGTIGGYCDCCKIAKACVPDEAKNLIKQRDQTRLTDHTKLNITALDEKMACNAYKENFWREFVT